MDQVHVAGTVRNGLCRYPAQMSEGPKLASSSEDVSGILNTNNKSKGQTNLTKGNQPKEASSYAIVHFQVHAESINIHVAQGNGNDLMPSQSDANDSATILIDTGPEQNYDVVTPPNASNNVQFINETGVSFRGRMQKLSRR